MIHKNIHIFTNTFGKYKRQDICIDAIKELIKNNSNINASLIQYEDDIVEYDLPVIRTLNRNSKDVIGGNRKFPFINDILDISCNNSKDIFVWCNSDIIIHQNLIDYINNTDVEAFAVTRTEIDDIDSIFSDAKIIRNEPAGFDCFVISKTWWNNNHHLFQDMIIGRPFFDVMYALLMLLNSNNIYVSKNHMIFHMVHEKQSFTNDEYYHYNRKQKELHYQWIENIWGELCNNTFLKRNDIGRFLNVNIDENNIIHQIKKKYITK
jgi:hypothetical protein